MARNFVQDILKKKKAEAASDYAASDEELNNIAPHVYELLTRKVRDDKKTLGTASLALWASGGSWHGSLNHRGIGVKWLAEADTLYGVIKALEKAVGQQEGTETNGKPETRQARS